jgi:UDP-N-acetylmuramyl pentapeptide phosphotransferase/UDP-N-acetylglucosamine-1-phosphate transferase
MVYAFGLIFAAIIYDSMITFFKRIFERKNVTEAHREHLYQRLVILGYTHRQVGTLYFLASLIFGILAIMFMATSYFVYRIIIISVVLAILLFASVVVSKIEKVKPNE